MKRTANRIIAIALLLGVIAAAAVATACGGVPSDAVATVGDVSVSKSQFTTLMNQVKAQVENQGMTFPAKGSTIWNSYAAGIVDYLVQAQVVAQGASGEGVSVTDKEVDAQITSLEKTYGGEESLLALLEQQGMTIALLKMSIRDSLLTQKVSAAVIKDVKVGDAQLEEHWQKSSAGYQKKASRTVRHVLTKTKAQALAARAALLAGSSWKDVAKKYSTDAATKTKGGSLGAVHRGETIAAFEKAAFSLGLRTISQPVETEHGWHVIQVTKVTPARTVTYDQVKKKLRTKLLRQARNKAWSTWLDDTAANLGVAYADGYDPDKLTATASPSPSASPSAAATE